MSLFPKKVEYPFKYLLLTAILQMQPFTPSSFVLLVMVDLNTYPVSHKCGSGCELAWPGWAKPQRQSEPQSHDPSEAAGSALTRQLH